MGYKIIFDADKCVGCGQCVDICPVSVWELHDGKSDPVNAEECLGCESSTGVCEHVAIVIEEDLRPWGDFPSARAAQAVRAGRFCGRPADDRSHPRS